MQELIVSTEFGTFEENVEAFMCLSLMTNFIWFI